MLAAGSEFRYAAEPAGRFDGRAFHWRVPRDIAGPDEVFAAFSSALWLPPECGETWDGLFASLCDLGWMSDRIIVLAHEALPKLSERELRIYLVTLRDAVRWWMDDDPHQLRVVFPQRDRARIAVLLS